MLKLFFLSDSNDILVNLKIESALSQPEKSSGPERVLYTIDLNGQALHFQPKDVTVYERDQKEFYQDIEKYVLDMFEKNPEMQRISVVDPDEPGNYVLGDVDLNQIIDDTLANWQTDATE